MAKYWEKRRQIFGPDKFHLSLTLQGGAFDDNDFRALKSGTFCPLPQRDVSGRQLLWFTLARNDFQGYTSANLVRNGLVYLGKESFSNGLSLYNISLPLTAGLSQFRNH
jgi:hypothetical protein